MQIHSPRQLVSLLPHLLGYHPHERLVLAALCDGVVMCLASTPWPDVSLDDLRPVWNTARHHDGCSVVSIVYSQQPVSQRQVVDAVAEIDDVALLDSLCVAGQMWRSLLCTDVDCCPEAGHRIDDTDEVLVNRVAAGFAPYACRTDLLAALRPHSGARTSPDGQGQGVAPLSAHGASTDLLEEIVEGIANASVSNPEYVAYLGRVLADFRIRDAFLRRLLAEPQLRQLSSARLIDLVSQVDPNHRSAWLTTVGGAVWIDGNADLASAAIDSALDCDPTYSLARLLSRAISAGVPAKVWRDSLEAVSVDECLQGAA